MSRDATEAFAGLVAFAGWEFGIFAALVGAGVATGAGAGAAAGGGALAVTVDLPQCGQSAIPPAA